MNASDRDEIAERLDATAARLEQIGLPRTGIDFARDLALRALQDTRIAQEILAKVEPQ
jgi:hypothetical protein